MLLIESVEISNHQLNLLVNNLLSVYYRKRTQRIGNVKRTTEALTQFIQSMLNIVITHQNNKTTHRDWFIHGPVYYLNVASVSILSFSISL